MRCGLAIFVKTPGHSPIKTRLAADVGVVFAEHFHRLAAQAVAQVAIAAIAPARALGIELCPHWAIAEPAAQNDPAWSALPGINQGEGDLGSRMAKVHGELLHGHHAAILIGADAPQVNAQFLVDAACAVRDAGSRGAIGPANDGGFWLFASNCRLPEACWTSVPYSRDDTAERFRATADQIEHWTELPTLTDVDRSQDLPVLVHQLQQLPAVTPGQLALLHWLRGELATRPTDLP